MSLLTLLLALGLERIWARSPWWHWHTGFARWFDWWLPAGVTPPPWRLVAAVLGPALVISLLLWGLAPLPAWLLTFGVLVANLGNPWLQGLYRRYLRAVGSGDQEQRQRCIEAFARLRHPTRPESLSSAEVGTALAWINYRFYFAVICAFVVAGAPGVALYGSLVSSRLLLQGRAPGSRALRRTEQLLRLLDWLPTRLLMLGYVVMGELPRALPIWLESLADWRRPESDWVAEVAMAAEPVSESMDPMHIQTTCHLVALGKRTVLLLLGAIAVMTLYGAVI